MLLFLPFSSLFIGTTYQSTAILILVITQPNSIRTGALLVFVICFHSTQNFLAASLSFSGGVMLYVSFVSILVKSQEEFVAYGFAPNRAWEIPPACFFAGALIVYLLDAAVHKLHASPRDLAAAVFRSRLARSFVTGTSYADSHKHCVSAVDPRSPSSRETSNPLSFFQQQHQQHQQYHHSTVYPQTGDPLANVDEEAAESNESSNAAVADQLYNGPQQEPTASDPTNTMADGKEPALGKLGILTALSISLHNLPEGAAVYVSATSGASVGIVVAIAIALHNIPVRSDHALRQRMLAILFLMRSGLMTV